MRKIFPFLLLLLLPEVILAEAPVEPARDAASILKLVADAKELLKTEIPKSVQKVVRGKKGRAVITTDSEALRVTLTPAGTLRVVRINPFAKLGDDFFQVISPAQCVAEKLGGGGINTNYRITCDGQKELVLASRRKDDIYAPYSDELALPQIIERGQMYDQYQIDLAAQKLRELGVYSRAFKDMLVVDVISKKTLFYLSLIEHIDHDEYRARGPEYCMNKVLTQFGLNDTKTFLYAVSSAKARGLMQLMPGTYGDVRRAYQKANLPKSPVDGSADHVTAIEAAYLVLDEKLSSMPSGLRIKILTDQDNYGPYLAASYNGGWKRALNLYQAYERPDSGFAAVLSDFFDLFRGRKAKNQMSRILRKETWIFVKKYYEIAKLGKP